MLTSGALFLCGYGRGGGSVLSFQTETLRGGREGPAGEQHALLPPLASFLGTLISWLELVLGQKMMSKNVSKQKCQNDRIPIGVSYFSGYIYSLILSSMLRIQKRQYLQFLEVTQNLTVQVKLHVNVVLGQ